MCVVSVCVCKCVQVEIAQRRLFTSTACLSAPATYIIYEHAHSGTSVGPISLLVLSAGIESQNNNACVAKAFFGGLATAKMLVGPVDPVNIRSVVMNH